MEELPFVGEVPRAARFFDAALLAESGEVVGDGFFLDGVQHVFDLVRGGAGVHCFEVSDGDDEGVGAVGDDVALVDLQAVISEAIEELAALITAELVDFPADAGGSIGRGRLRDELVNGVGDLVDVLIAACTCDAFALGVAGWMVDVESGAVLPDQCLQEADDGADGTDAEVDTSEFKDGFPGVDDHEGVAAGFEFFFQLQQASGRAGP